MAAREEIFDEVELGSLTRTPCSPEEPDHTFKGILINAPSRVTFRRGDKIGPKGAFASIPICGYYMVDVVNPPQYLPGPLEAMILVAINKKTQITLSGSVVDPLPFKRHDPTNTGRQSKTRDFNVAAGGYFNPNLAERVPLPAAPGTYDVHIELGDKDLNNFIQSNTVTIEIAEEQ